MPKNRTLKIVAGIIGSFAGLAGTIIYLFATEVISVQLAMLSLVALVGLYFGFGFLIAVYRLIAKLD
jgi:hypothetical protein